MTLNPAYEAIGKGFVQQYYAMFDDPAQRPNLINMYNVRKNGILSLSFFIITCRLSYHCICGLDWRWVFLIVVEGG